MVILIVKKGHSIPLGVQGGFMLLSMCYNGCMVSFKGGGVNLKGLVPMIYETEKDTMACLYFRHYNWQLISRDYLSRLRC